MGDKEMAPKDVLFEAIFSIKRSHNKPNTARICSYLFKKYSITANRCIKAINHYTLTGEIEVVNAGTAASETSYRVSEQPPLSSLDDLPSLQGSMINKFMAELIINEPNYLNDGVPPARLVNFVAEKQPTLSRREIVESIRAELSSGNLDMFANGNYGYSPVDSSDDEPMSEPEEKRRKFTPAAPSPSSKTKSPASSVPATAEKPNSNKSTGDKSNAVKPTVVGSKSATADKSNVEKGAVEIRRGARAGPRAEEKKEAGESKENERKEEAALGRGGTRRRKRNKCYVRDDAFQPGSKDFKVDLSLERQARKRKEKKIFDPSADDESKRSRRGRNGSKAEEPVQACSAAPVTARKLISPAKSRVLLSGTSVKVGSSPSVQCPPGGRTAITPLVPTSVCYLCQTYGKRIKGVPEKLIPCLKCTTSKVHISCLNEGRGSTEKVSSHAVVNNWTCKKCNLTCVYCNQVKPGIYILECIECKSGFHIPCHRSLIPPLSKSYSILPAEFKCVRCVPPQQQGSHPTPPVKESAKQDTKSPVADVDSGKQEFPPSLQPKVILTPLKAKVPSFGVATDSSTSLRPQSESPQQAPTIPSPDVGHRPAQVSSPTCTLEDPYAHIPQDPVVPDCRGWSCQEVNGYLRRYLQPALCQPLLDVAVDGKALLLMRRSDCIESLGLPLGFGLKLWAHVKRLQTKRSKIVQLIYDE